MIRILVADDHPLVREGLMARLDAEPDLSVVGEASDGIQACEMVDALKPDVVLMDISMPRLSGVDACKKILRTGPSTKVLILTMHANREYLLSIMRSGARGYVLKEAAVTEIINAIKAVHSGGTYFSAKMSDLLLQESGCAAPESRLSEREQQILVLLAKGASNKEVADRLCISARTVETHRGHIKAKLGVSSFADMVRYAVDSGLIEH